MYGTFDISQSDLKIQKGAPLPTDHKETNILLVAQLEETLNRNRILFEKNSSIAQAPIGEIKNYRYHLEELLFENNEKKFAENQKNEWDEILAYMDVLISTRPMSIEIGDKEISISVRRKTSIF